MFAALVLASIWSRNVIVRYKLFWLFAYLAEHRNSFFPIFVRTISVAEQSVHPYTKQTKNKKKQEMNTKNNTKQKFKQQTTNQDKTKTKQKQDKIQTKPLNKAKWKLKINHKTKWETKHYKTRQTKQNKQKV